MIFLYVLLYLLLGTTIVFFGVLFNWRVLTMLKGAPSYRLRRLAYSYRHIETIEGSLQEDKVRPIIGSVCHVTFFPCDLKYLGQLALCYTSADSDYYWRQGIHWRGKCPFDWRNDAS